MDFFKRLHRYAAKRIHCHCAVPAGAVDGLNGNHIDTYAHLHFNKFCKNVGSTTEQRKLGDNAAPDALDHKSSPPLLPLIQHPVEIQEVKC